MSYGFVPLNASWKGSRYGFVAFHVTSLVAVWCVLRFVLYLAFGPASAPDEVVLAFLSGLQRDLLAALALTLPLAAWLLVMPQGWRNARWYRRLFWTLYFVFWFVWIFLMFVEAFFFEEFKSRFNTVAVDYLWYPHEVFVNIWESYHVGIILCVCLV